MPEGTRDLEVSIESEHWVGRSARGVWRAHGVQGSPLTLAEEDGSALKKECIAYYTTPTSVRCFIIAQPRTDNLHVLISLLRRLLLTGMFMLRHLYQKFMSVYGMLIGKYGRLHFPDDASSSSGWLFRFGIYLKPWIL
jgi:hypothetical protein